MKKYPLIGKGLTVSVILLFVATGIIPSIAQDIGKSSQPAARGNWLYVGGSGPGNYTKIQDAIDDASDGDTVFVYDDSSPYFENIVVNKKIQLIGEDRNTTIIDGNGTGYVVNLRSDSISINGFKIIHSGSGINSGGLVVSSNNDSIQNNIISDNGDTGVYILFGTNTTIKDNFILNNNGSGIQLATAGHNTLISNHISSNRDAGIRMSGNNNSIINNIISANFYNGILFDYKAQFNIIEENTISNQQVYHGIDIWFGENNSFINNDIFNNSFGIRTTTNTKNNHFYHNNFFNNTKQVEDVSLNQWDNGYPSGGNYWSDYNGTDVTQDGIGDSPYNISGGTNQDHYPLMLPYGMTNLTINLVPGTFKFLISIKNVGSTTALNVQSLLTLKGGFLFCTREIVGVTRPLLPGEEIAITLPIFFFGFGYIRMNNSVWADNALIFTQKINGILLLFFFIHKH
ncbi:MAG: right-handed parallel beta-helix repeat-containing protein [Actinobacteria bacterium]|nr:right-handed parallel beta-helix repeat-containing protein [Actinomycetota bacterium]MBE3122659.1 right-handed parallel beta-helix repeat-containing protein [Thermoplasmata archaeon]